TEMKLRYVVVVYNRFGGSFRQNVLSSLQSELGQHGTRVDAWATEAHPTSAIELASKAAAAGADLVIGMGGDWMVRSIAEGLRGAGVPMAICKGGTGNLFGNVY